MAHHEQQEQKSPLHIAAQKQQCEARTKRSRHKLQCKRNAYSSGPTCKCHTPRQVESFNQ